MRVNLGFILLVGGCASNVTSLGAGTDTGAETETGNPAISSTGSTPVSATDVDTTQSTTNDTSATSDSTGLAELCDGENCLVDILVVVDNSRAMQDAQAEFARALVGLEQAMLDRGLDTHVMFTTTDRGNPNCTPFKPDGYEPANAAPIRTACTDRLQDFNGLDGALTQDVCTDVCPASAAPMGNYVAFSPGETNVPLAPDVDINGDGMPDSSTAQALACLAPMGVNGCGFESQLETVLQGTNPSAVWNQGPNAFLRADATLAIVLLSDEADCSVEDFSLMSDPAYLEISPQTGKPAVSSALCWNAGVACDGPDPTGVYANCEPAVETPLQGTSRYINYLVSEIRDGQGKPVVMLALTGVPAVTEHAATPPYTPTAGGVLDLTIRDWRDGLYPGGDILPEAFNDGLNAATMEFAFGIGPGCSAVDGPNGAEVQGVPPVRVRQVCEALSYSDALEDQRCCLESICDSNYAPALECLVGLIGHTTIP